MIVLVACESEEVELDFFLTISVGDEGSKCVYVERRRDLLVNSGVDFLSCKWQPVVFLEGANEDWP